MIRGFFWEVEVEVVGVMYMVWLCSWVAFLFGMVHCLWRWVCVVVVLVGFLIIELVG